jgi:hypothetical protein
LRTATNANEFVRLHKTETGRKTMNEKEAKLEGFYESYDVFHHAIDRLKTSLNDYAAIEYQDFYPKKHNDKVAFAHNTLAVLEELFMDAYNQKIDPLKWELKNDLE